MSGCEKVFHTMKEKGMDLAVLIDPADIKYVSGFEVPFWPAWMGDVSNGLPMVTAIVDAKREQVQLVASDMYRNKIIRTGITNAFYFRSFTHLENNDVDDNYKSNMEHALGEAADGRNSLVVGIEENYIPECTMSVIRKVIPQCTFENATQVLRSARYIKTIAFEFYKVYI